jgi:hypothetical protein
VAPSTSSCRGTASSCCTCIREAGNHLATAPATAMSTRQGPWCHPDQAQATPKRMLAVLKSAAALAVRGLAV